MRVPVSVCASDTKSFQGVGHGLVLHHVDESSSQTEVREDEQDVLQDIVDSSDFLQKTAFTSETLGLVAVAGRHGNSRCFQTAP